MIRAIVLTALLFLSACVSTPSGDPLPPREPASEAVQLTTTTGVIHGTLLIPSGLTGPIPVAVILAGSGPTDRDGNSAALPGANNSLRHVAETLASNGIATLRYDKRGIAASSSAGSAEEDLSFEHYVADAVDWIRQLRRDARFSTVAVVGHSEGSLIGMIAARIANADGFISIAGAGRSAPEILREQLQPMLPVILWEASERILSALISGETATDVPPELAMLYRPSVQPYLISWFAHDPVREIARLEVPVLIVQGSADIQVLPRDAEALHRSAPGSELVLINGMNHVLRIVDADRAKQIASYSDPDLPLAPELGARIVEFVLRLGS